ncbi:RDD family protein [Candidatus Poriferisodalis sp.]|uniref:RDD family protein n=1 Tax=Candidatus Poriferisodalis sp. TaxID=3101277 RepID=UPI003B022801
MTSSAPWPPLGRPDRPGAILDAANPFRRFAALLVDGLVSTLTFGIGWLIWLAFTLRRGQTPGKQVLGLVAVRADGTSFGWGRMFAREVLKHVFWTVTIGIGFLADALLILLGDDESRSVTDRLIGSRVINRPRPSS